MADLTSKRAVIDAITKYCTKYDLRELLADIETLPIIKPETNVLTVKVEFSEEEIKAMMEKIGRGIIRNE